MLRIVVPLAAKRYEGSRFGDELNEFCCWLQHAGYSKHTTGRHLRRLFQVLTQSGVSVKGRNVT